MIRKRTLLLVVTTLALTATMLARAQGPNPPTDEVQPKRPLPGTSTDEQAVEAPKIESPAVAAVLASQPQTPADALQAAVMLIDLGRPELAKPFVRQLTSLTADALAELPQGGGKAALFKLALTPAVSPEGRQIADAALAAFEARVKDPQRLAAAVQALNDPSATVRSGALEDLRAAGSSGVASVIAVFSDPASAAERPNLKAALIALSANSTEPLLGLLETQDDALKAEAIDILGRSGNPEVIEYLIGPAMSSKSSLALRTAAQAGLTRLAGGVPEPLQAEKYLREKVKAYYDRAQPLPITPSGSVELWRWDPMHRQSAAVEYSPAQASTVLAARLGRDLVELAPDQRDYQRWHLAAMLEEAASRAGLQNPLAKDGAYGVAIAQSPDAIEDVLSFAMASNHPIAATAAAKVLGELGGVDMLTRSGKPSPLALAARHPDRRLRMAAVEAILKLQPQTSFAGSSYVPEALGYFATSTGTRKAIVGHPRIDVAQNLAALLMQLGYEAIPVTDGRELFKTAAAEPDAELILMSIGMERPISTILLEELHRDKRTGKLPVGVLSGQDQFERAKEVAAGDPLAEPFPEPKNVAGMKILVERLLDRAGTGAVLPQERRQQAAKAMNYLAAISSEKQSLYDLRRQEPAVQSALYEPALTQPAVDVLASLGTASSQRELIDLASRAGQPLGARRAAVAAFGQSVSRYGIRLTSEEITRQYDRYNKSASADRDTQQVLADILDWIEMPSRTRTDKR